jgi:hypothetical protein
MMNSRKSMAASAPTFVATNTAGGYRNAAGASVVGQGGQENDGLTFFEREKARLIEEINGVSTSGSTCTYPVSSKSHFITPAADMSGDAFLKKKKNFEQLLNSSNTLNRKLEEVLGVGKEFQTVADLWGVSRDLCIA